MYDESYGMNDVWGNRRRGMVCHPCALRGGERLKNF